MTTVRPKASLPLDDWPASDKAAWEKALSPGDIFDDAGQAAHWRPATQGTVEDAWGRYLSFLKANGWLEDAATPAERLRQDHLGAYVDALRAEGRASFTVWSYIDHLDHFLKVTDPAAERTALRRVVNRLKAAAKTMRDITARIMPAEQILGRALTWLDETAMRPPRRPSSPLVDIRDGLMIALVICRPLRLSSLANLRIGRHLVRRDDGYALYLDEEDVKTGLPLDFPLPEALTPWMDHYLDVVRPQLLCGNFSERLWINRYGGEMKPHNISGRFKKATPRILGKRMSAHDFRYAAATSYAIEDPEHVKATKALLGHTTLRMAEAHYNKAQGIEASRSYHAGLRDLKRRLLEELPVNERPR